MAFSGGIIIFFICRRNISVLHNSVSKTLSFSLILEGVYVCDYQKRKRVLLRAVGGEAVDLTIVVRLSCLQIIFFQESFFFLISTSSSFL